MSQTPIATRAAHFMRQCRTHRTHTQLTHHTRTAIRAVSSSHLAPSNFSKQTRRRDAEVAYPRFADLTTRPSNAKKRPLSPPSDTLTLGSNSATPIPAGIISFLKYRILNLTPPPPPAHKPPSFTVLNNPYRAKKKWPPDFDSMHPRQQFAFEKTFRRRLMLKTDSKRYNWNRYVRLLQQSLIVLTVGYFIFIADPYKKDGGGTPVDGFRAWFFGQVSRFEHLPEGLRGQAGELKEYYEKNWKKAPWAEAEGDSDGDGGGSPVGNGEAKDITTM